jgi:hypothetical protein
VTLVTQTFRHEIPANAEAPEMLIFLLNILYDLFYRKNLIYSILNANVFLQINQQITTKTASRIDLNRHRIHEKHNFTASFYILKHVSGQLSSGNKTNITSRSERRAHHSSLIKKGAFRN